MFLFSMRDIVTGAAFAVRVSLWRNTHLIWVLVKATVWNFYFTVKYQFQNHSLTCNTANRFGVFPALFWEDVC